MFSGLRTISTYICHKCMNVPFLLMGICNRTRFKLSKYLRSDPCVGQVGSRCVASGSGHGSGGSKVPLTATVPREHTPSLLKARKLSRCRLLGRHDRQPILSNKMRLYRSMDELWEWWLQIGCENIRSYHQGYLDHYICTCQAVLLPS